VKKLQISLPDFRRLCIFKGIYPREPRNKKKVSKGSTAATTFYYTKDIQYLLHEPLLAKFREHKSVAKKIGRALGRGESGDAARLEKNLMPKVKLDHIIKERYPTFVDALRDLDDVLSMLFLFANLPSSEHIPAKTIALCQRLTREFEHYVITSHALRKSFLSIKGIYYQATIQGQDILWLVPYRFVQRTGGDIDFRIMGTFVEFYTTLLGFVNYRLYTSVGLVYPPKFNAKSDEQGGELAAFQLEGKVNASNGAMNGHDEDAEIDPEAQAIADRIGAMPDIEEEQDEQTAVAKVANDEDDDEEMNEEIDKFEPTAPDADFLPQPQASSAEVASLFAPFTFYLSRETPRASLEFILKAFGSKRVGWDGMLGDGAFTTNESDPAITHQIVDRPALSTGNVPETENGGAAAPKVQWPYSTMPGRTYVQPQWVWDCLNQSKLLRPDLYAPGADLPPHLSPWVKPKKGEYDPNLPLEVQQPDGEAEAFDDDDGEEEEATFDIDGDENMDAIADRAASVEVGEGMDVASEDDDEDDDDSDDDSDAAAPAAEEVDDVESDAESDISEGEAARLQHQRELEAEATGKKLEVKAPTKKEQNASIRKKFDKKRREEEEERDRQKMMLSNKKRKLLKRIEYGENKRDTESENLRRKRAKLEKAKAAAEAV
jgi:pescadillo protein